MDDQKKWILGGAGLIIVALLIWSLVAAREEGSRENIEGDAVMADDWIKGPADALVTLIEYSDFQCPACGAYFPVVRDLGLAYPADLRVVARHYPLIQMHPNALPAARVAEAAGRQGKFFDMHDLLFSKQTEWSKLPEPRDTFIGYAEALSLNKEKFLADLDDKTLDDRINRHMKAGDDAGVTGTPTFLLNGKKIQNPNTLEAFKALIDAELGKDDEKKEEPKPEEKEKENGQAVHEHADFRVYIEGRVIDFAQDKYQSTGEKKPLDEHIHLHDKNGNVIHKHWSGVTLGDFFKSLMMELTKGCFRTDTGEAYCSGPAKTLKVWVNGQPSEKFDTLEFQDGDRILISYGSEDAKALQMQMDSVSRDSCIYSEKCPERGTPPTEGCVGGLGTDCLKE